MMFWTRHAMGMYHPSNGGHVNHAGWGPHVHSASCSMTMHLACDCRSTMLTHKSQYLRWHKASPQQLLHQLQRAHRATWHVWCVPCCGLPLVPWIKHTTQ